MASCTYSTVYICYLHFCRSVCCKNALFWQGLSSTDESASELLSVCLYVELLKDLLQERPVEEADLDTIIVVDNAPKVGPDRMSKLKIVLNKVFARFGEIVTQDYPTDDNGIFKG